MLIPGDRAGSEFKLTVRQRMDNDLMCVHHLDKLAYFMPLVLAPRTLEAVIKVRVSTKLKMCVDDFENFFRIS